MDMFCNGQWKNSSETLNVNNPFDNSLVDTVPSATTDDVNEAIVCLQDGAKTMRRLAAHERAQILSRTAALVRERQAEFADIISREEGKILAESTIEVQRGAEILETSAHEAQRMTGEMIPLEGTAAGENKIGFTLRVPCGVVAAITPFNFPLHLVAHKLGPAIAAGNAVLLKPATDTPLSALMLIECLLQAGMPQDAIACLTGPGRSLGVAICNHPAIRKISFTGSYEVGDAICRAAGMKRVTMELGSNSPVIVMDDADLEKAAKVVTMNGFSNAGQVCISAQRILVSSACRADFMDLLKPSVEALATGNQLDQGTQVGPLVRERDAIRVEECIRQATETGAKLLVGGGRSGAMIQPAILDDVSPEARISKEELFGPAIAVTYFDDIHAAVDLANDSPFGLSAGIFTQDIDRAMFFARNVDSGNLHINWGSQWRADTMPYGGLKHSGTGKEGPQYAIREMSEEKMVVMHLATPKK
jgi:acyl-CoA reductase-like NAD-dependent aldehyde dehydrogenase